MGCNAWNHSVDCDCGWGGDTGGGDFAVTSPKQSLGLSDGFVNPNARCPVCGDPVFYYESPNGGKVWFDELGPPWPKHPCMASQSATVRSYGELLEFTGTNLAPSAAMKMAAELVRYAMKDFRAPKREWPDDELSASRSELLDWMFRRHETGGDHVVPLKDFLQIVGYIEARAKFAVDWLPTHLEVTERLGSDDKKTKKQTAVFKKNAERGRRTLAIMAQLRAHYERGEDEDGQRVKIVKE